MRGALVLTLAVLVFTVCPEPVEGRAPDARTSTSSARTAEDVDQVARRYGLAGEVLVATGSQVLLDRGYGTIDPKGGTRHRPGERWRLASITKQIVAAMIVKATGPDALDRPVASADRAMIGQLTIRQLLTHHTGLANPDDTPAGAGGVPSFYQAVDPDIGYCFSKPPRPGASFAYNNCDYILASIFLGLNEANDPSILPGVRWAKRNERGVPGFVGGRAEPAFQLASWGAAGGLMGTARAVFDFDRRLMTGQLLSLPALAELWKPESNGSYQALGQWVFPGKLAGCAAPKRIVQRDGEIYGVQARNFILPDDDLVVIVFTNRSSDDFAIGEVWQGKGFAYDLLSAAVCS